MCLRHLIIVETFSSNRKFFTWNEMVRLALAAKRNGSVVDISSTNHRNMYSNFSEKLAKVRKW